MAFSEDKIPGTVFRTILSNGLNSMFEKISLFPSADGLPVQELRILLIDDDPFMLELIAEMLHEFGIRRVFAALDGRQGIEAFEQLHLELDLIISDLNMPNGDGFQLMEYFGSKKFKGGVVLLSGLEERVLKSATLMGRLHSLRVLGILQKPVTREALKVLLGKAVMCS